MPPPPSATYQRLRETITDRMRMSPIDQPLMLMELLGLTGNGITTNGDGHDSLIGSDELSDGERDALLELCRQRLDAFREQRGEEVFAHRSRHRTPISGSVKYRVLTRARRRCECCGAHEHQRALEVDPIIPRNHGGSDAISNLQGLCFRCNAGKQWPSLVSELHRQ